jgi:hypothetical protein
MSSKADESANILRGVNAAAAAKPPFCSSLLLVTRNLFMAEALDKKVHFVGNAPRVFLLL